MKSGAELIAEERLRQASQEGWDEAHDDKHTKNELVTAAICYLVPTWTRHFWPWDLSFWKPKDRLKNLVRAGALIAAEIDRLSREESRKAQNETLRHQSGRDLQEQGCRENQADSA